MRPSTIATLAMLAGCASPEGGDLHRGGGASRTGTSPVTTGGYTDVGPPGFAVGEDRCPQFDDGIPCIDVDTFPPTWTHDPTVYRILDLDVPGDIDGDGYADASVIVQTSDGDEQTFVVFGPLNRARVLPDDADMTFLDPVSFADITGDGVLDASIVGWGEFSVASGPITGPESLSTAIGPLAGYPGSDLDADGALDRIVTDDAARVTSVWLDGWATWLGAPTFTVTDPCWAVLDAPQIIGPHYDYDGDGVVLMGAYATRFSDVTMHDWVSDCAADYAVPSDARGEIVLGVSPEVVVDAFEPKRSVPDQDGDGDPEWITEAGLLAGPLAPDGTGTPLYEALHPSFSDVNNLYGGEDRDSDGYADLAYFVPHSHNEELDSVLLLRGGPNGGLTTGTAYQRTLGTTIDQHVYEDARWLGIGDGAAHGQIVVIELPR